MRRKAENRKNPQQQQSKRRKKLFLLELICKQSYIRIQSTLINVSLVGTECFYVLDMGVIMRARVLKKDLLPAVMRTVSIADRKSVVPILSHVLLDFRDGSLCIKATDLDHAIIENVPAQVDTFGVVAVPALMLSEIVRKSSAEAPLEFSLMDKGNKLLIVSERSKFELSALDSKDFPEIAPINSSFGLNLDPLALNKLISRTKFSMSPEESRHNLNGIFLHKEDDRLVAASTDGHRLSTTSIPIDIKENIQRVIISRKTVFEVKKLLDASLEHVSVGVSFSANQVQFVFGEVTFISKLVDGTFPEYKRVIPQETSSLFVVDRLSFCESLARIAVISEEKVRSVKLELSKAGVLTCYAINSQIGSGQDELDVTYESGKEWSSGFNATYLLDAATAVRGDNLKVFIKEALSPILIVDEGEPESKFVVMPMRM